MTIYYIDSSSQNASDSNAGTGTNAPLKSLAAIAHLNLHPGDTVAIRAGTSYEGSADGSPLVAISASGTADAPISITRYGTGSDPVIANNSTSMYSDAISLKNAHYVNIDNLHFTGASEAAINIDASSSNIVVRDSEFENVGEGVLLKGSNSVITHNYFHDLHMVKNTPQTVNSNDDYGANAIVIAGSSNEFSYNYTANARAPSYDYGFDGGVVELWGSISDVKIEGNYGTDSAGFLEAGGSQGSTMRNVTVTGNVSLNNGQFVVVHNSGVFGVDLEGFVVENNSVAELSAGPHTSSLIYLDKTAQASDFTFEHNAISMSYGDSVFKQMGDYHSDNVILLSNKAIHLYNNWSMALGSGETFADPVFGDTSIGDFVSQLVGQNSVGAKILIDDILHSVHLAGTVDAEGDDTGYNVLQKHGNQDITTFAGNDRIITGAGRDRIDSGDGNDFLKTGFANDTITTGTGDSIVQAGAGNDRISGGTGDSRFYGAAGNDRISVQSGINLLSGGGGDDILRGGNGGDHLIGGRGADVIRGGSGMDTIWLDGEDHARGGTGADTFVFRQTGNDYAKIVDFSLAEGDVIDLSAVREKLGLPAENFVDLLTMTSHHGHYFLGIDLGQDRGGGELAEIRPDTAGDVVSMANVTQWLVA